MTVNQTRQLESRPGAGRNNDERARPRHSDFAGRSLCKATAFKVANHDGDLGSLDCLGNKIRVLEKGIRRRGHALQAQRRGTSLRGLDGSRRLLFCR